MKDLPKRHQHAIVPQKRDGHGQYQRKPRQQQTAPDKLIGKPQQLPTFISSTTGPESS